jgi:hypothetical protein
LFNSISVSVLKTSGCGRPSNSKYIFANRVKKMGLSVRRKSIKFPSQIVLIILYVHSQLDLTLQSEEGGDISNFNTNGEWDLLGMATVTTCTRLPLLFMFGLLSKRAALLNFFSCHCSLLIQNVFAAPSGG